MESAVFKICLLFELVLVVLEVIKKSEQRKARNLIRIGLFFGFVTGLLTNVITWDLRWAAFGSLLLVWTGLAAFQLMGRLKYNPAKSPGSMIWRAIGNSLLLMVVMLPALVFPTYKPISPTGGYKVASLVETFTDTERMEPYSKEPGYRSITVQCWYPLGSEGLNPLVVFSHGSFGVRTSNESLFNELASHGYVTCSLDHPYQSFFSTDVNGNTVYLDSEFMREVSSENAKEDPQRSSELYQKWMAIRTADINFVINTLIDLGKQDNSPTIFHQIDPTRIGVIGHSMGGSAALAVGRQRADVDAVMALEAPFMGDVMGVENGKFVWNKDSYPLPVLNIYSDSSWSHLKEWPQYTENVWLLEDTHPEVENVYLAGAKHLTLTDLALTSPFLTNVLNGGKADLDARECLTEINRFALEFLDKYLR